MKAQHTPSPWRCSHIETHEAPNNTVNSFEVYTDPAAEHSNAIGAANARLIAAAPELLEALKDANRMMNEHFQVSDIDEGGNATHDKIRAAIAKAAN